MSTTPVTANRIRILTVDDHPLILEGIANVLQRQPDMELVGEASDGYQAIEAFGKVQARCSVDRPADAGYERDRYHYRNS